jgi:hypothetical protein
VFADKLEIGLERKKRIKSITRTIGLNNFKNGFSMEEN